MRRYGPTAKAVAMCIAVALSGCIQSDEAEPGERIQRYAALNEVPELRLFQEPVRIDAPGPGWAMSSLRLTPTDQGDGTSGVVLLFLIDVACPSDASDAFMMVALRAVGADVEAPGIPFFVALPNGTVPGTLTAEASNDGPGFDYTDVALLVGGSSCSVEVAVQLVDPSNTTALQQGGLEAFQNPGLPLVAPDGTGSAGFAGSYSWSSLEGEVMEVSMGRIEATMEQQPGTMDLTQVRSWQVSADGEMQNPGTFSLAAVDQMKGRHRTTWAYAQSDGSGEANAEGAWSNPTVPANAPEPAAPPTVVSMGSIGAGSVAFSWTGEATTPGPLLGAIAPPGDINHIVTWGYADVDLQATYGWDLLEVRPGGGGVLSGPGPVPSVPGVSFGPSPTDIRIDLGERRDPLAASPFSIGPR